MTTAAPRVIGRYVLHEPIASGGMATVHLGRLVGPAGFARTVAIKKLHAQLAQDPEFLAMFMDEARLAARVSHPNVVPTLDVVAADGELLLVMAYVQGESLSHLRRAVPKGDRVPRDVALAIVCDVLYGLHAAHEAKGEHGEPLEIVHRDVSPQNVLVAREGAALIADFGVAKAVARAATTRDGQVKGKLSYMAPEQLVGGIVDRRTDVFAASIVLWELVTGERLFQGDDTGEVMARVLTAPIPCARAIAPDTPPKLDALLARGLSRSPDGRFSTAREMAAAIEELGPARAAQVAAWMERVVGAELAERARRVASMERAPAPETNGAPASERATEILEEPSAVGAPPPEPPASPAPRGRATPRAKWPVAATLIALVGLAAPVARLLRAPHAADVAGAAPPPSGVAEPPSAPTSPSAPASERVAPSSATSSASHSAPPPRASAPAARARPRCDPPYFFDSDGVKRFKEACL